LNSRIQGYKTEEGEMRARHTVTRPKRGGVGRKAQSNAVVMCLPLKARAPYKPGMFVISDKIKLLQGNVAHYIISVFNLASGTPLGINAST
jgi:hypothetical protein